MIATNLCKAVLLLYPKEFRAEFASDIVASFTAHYREERRQGAGFLRIAAGQYRDIADLLRGALMERFRQIMAKFDSRKHRGEILELMEKGQDENMADYKIVWRVYLAWQAQEEADWLREMSGQGWEFVDYSWFVYYFRRREVPIEYEYKLERSFLLGWNTRIEKMYLESMREKGWEFIKYFLGWYYFRRPAADAKPETAAPVPEIRNYTRIGRAVGLLGLAALAALLAAVVASRGGNSVLNAIVRGSIIGICAGIGLVAAVLLAISLISILKDRRNQGRRFANNARLLAGVLIISVLAASLLVKYRPDISSLRYKESVRVDLARSAHDEAPVYKFALRKPAAWDYRLVLTGIDTPLIDIRLRGRGGADFLLLHGEGFWSNYYWTKGSLALTPDEYELVLTNKKAPGRLYLYFSRDSRP